MKVIKNIELLKRLQSYLWETEKYYNWRFTFHWATLRHCFKLWTEREENYYKAPTLEEALELLPSEINIWGRYACLKIQKSKWFYKILYTPILKTRNEFYDSLLEAVEKMLEYLLDNNLLWKPTTHS